jgi:hypothetical protein
MKIKLAKNIYQLMARKNNDQKGNIPVIEVVSKLMK